MMTDLLDLDSCETWHPDFKALVYSDEVWPNIESKLDAGDMQCNEFLLQITYVDESVKDDLAKFLRHKGKEILLSKYTHVVGYHGCRVREMTSYQFNGILPSNTELLIAEARSLFAEFGGTEKAIRDVGQWYLDHNEGKVGLLFSVIRARHDRTTYVKGSELIRGIANRLGSDAESLYERTGRCMLIKCAIPVDWLDRDTTLPTSGGYANHVLEELIRQRKWPDEEFIGCQGTYMLTKAVPPENILEFIDMTDSNNGGR